MQQAVWRNPSVQCSQYVNDSGASATALCLDAHEAVKCHIVSSLPATPAVPDPAYRRIRPHYCMCAR
jgi:hypothetical protein